VNRFEYIRPSSAAQAVVEAARPGSAYLAAGTNLLDLMKGGAASPERLIDISKLPGLDRIEWLLDGGVRIGALVRNADLAYDPKIQKTFPAVAEALLAGASPQLRNAATVGGNLLQRTRCAYFHDMASACNRRTPGSGCDAIGGENRLHAVLGWSEHCIATHPSDLCVPLVGLDAIVELEGAQGSREISLESLHCLPGDTPERETVLAPGDLIVAVRLPPEGAQLAAHARYLKVRERTSYAFALLRPSNWTVRQFAGRGWRSAASQQSHGALTSLKPNWWVPTRPRQRSPESLNSPSPRPRPPATTRSRSSSLVAWSFALCRTP
jgi:xanthine dehydrogenase YagS FAD-binding subunit